MERISYPADEAASPESIRLRMTEAGAFFLVCYWNEIPCGFINGTLSTSQQLSHESMAEHKPSGTLLCLHSVCVDAHYRRRGVATAMLTHYVSLIRKTQPQVVSIALLCKEHLQGFYNSCGFSLVGPSGVVHGQDQWFEMRLDI
jgi:GNAT superfamily N-acetyltransferase